MGRFVVILSALILLSGALAFQWTPLEFPEGDQSYTLELRTGEGEEAQVGRIRIDIDEDGGQYSVTTTYTMTQEGVGLDALSEAAFGGGMMGMFAFGPMMMFGPSFMMLPMMLGEEEIEVRSEPMRVMGMGQVFMDKTAQVAGHEWSSSASSPMRVMVSRWRWPKTCPSPVIRASNPTAA